VPEKGPGESLLHSYPDVYILFLKRHHFYSPVFENPYEPKDDREETEGRFRKLALKIRGTGAQCSIRTMDLAVSWDQHAHSRVLKQLRGGREAMTGSKNPVSGPQDLHPPTFNLPTYTYRQALCPPTVKHIVGFVVQASTLLPMY